MPSFSLVIEYLTGYAVATDPSNRERAEWPPHPARVFMALAAAHFESHGSPEEKRAEREALDWLATLPPPDVTIPEHSPRQVLTVYVPVNDQPGSEALLRRSRQPRVFPRVHIGSEPMRQTWHVPENPPGNHLDALESICRNVTRIGHSSSLVWARLERDTGTSLAKPTHVPHEDTLDGGMRIVHAGAMRRLEEAFNKSAIDEFTALEEQIDVAKGKAKKQLQSRSAERFPRGRPTSQRPVFSISRGYRRVEPPQADVPHTLFDPNFIVLREADDAGQTFGLESTAAITHALRGLLMSGSRVQPPPSWLSGHEPDGSRLVSGDHLAVIPLAYVGRPWIEVEAHADGHLMGVGIVPPRSISLRERAAVLAPILFDERTNKPRPLELRMGRAGTWRVERETGMSPRRTLREETYTVRSRSWASVTPVLLDRMPKADRVKHPSAWREEVALIVSQSCKAIGLPEPIAVHTEKTPFFLGSLRAMPGQGGFPQLRKDKHQVHVVVEFDRPVQGPVLIGAGRFRGYGLMRPWASKEGA
jgi:CRISPR-associated protein Csb2